MTPITYEVRNVNNLVIRTFGHADPRTAADRGTGDQRSWRPWSARREAGMNPAQRSPIWRFVEYVILGAAVFGGAALLARYGVGVVR
jgi:hypothetical protein